MILLFGGASETSLISQRLAGVGHAVLVSTATDIDLDIGAGPNIHRRMGKMDRDQMTVLIKDEGVTAVIDAAHPFATMARANARGAAKAAGVPYFTYLRPGGVYDYEKITAAGDHDQAARTAFSFGAPVLLTTGSRNLAPYADESRRTGIKIIARVLNHHSSIEACDAAGIAQECVIAERGPFTVATNLEHIDTHGAGTLVTKDSGSPGGVPEKIEAARRRGVNVVLVKRPEGSAPESFDDIDRLIEAFLMVTA